MSRVCQVKKNRKGIELTDDEVVYLRLLFMSKQLEIDDIGMYKSVLKEHSHEYAMISSISSKLPKPESTKDIHMSNMLEQAYNDGAQNVRFDFDINNYK